MKELQIAHITVDDIQEKIYFVRGQKVMLDVDLARIYGVTTKRLNQQVQRNEDRFPEDFMFQLTQKEAESLRLQIATSKEGRGGRRYQPRVFTEVGAIMISAVLKTPIAVHASIQIARAFVGMRRWLASQTELAKKLEELENKLMGHDDQIRELFRVIRQLMLLPKRKKRKIGYFP